MNEDIPEEDPIEPDSLGPFSIDERFNFKIPDAELAETFGSSLNPHSAETVGTPPRQPKIKGDPQNPGADEDDTPIGDKIGNYEILSVLGRGGFGTVYKAKDAKLQRFAAIKFLRFPLDREYRKLFAREAQVIANLGKHPSIVQIYQWGEYQGSHYFALEFLDTSAEGLIAAADGPLPVKRALEITAQCAGALHYAHENGVLHRDVKPANILIDKKSGQAKMCDFGLAKFHALGAGTATSTIAGSPPYMAPEQITGQTMDGRTDVYSLGVTLYELLSSKLPCTGSSQAEILERIRKRKGTPLRKFRPDLPPAVLEVVQRATAFRPDERFQSAEEMQRALEGIVKRIDKSGSSDSALAPISGPKARRSKALKRAAVAGLFATLLLTGWWMLGSDPPSNESPGGPKWPIAMASAKEDIESGDYASAITWLELYATENYEDDFAHYALGYARLLSEDLTGADESFNLIVDTGLRDEGRAAVLHERLEEDSRASLEIAAKKVPTGYPEVLLASLDIISAKYDDAIARLERIQREAFYFEWQRRQYAELLAKASTRGRGVDSAADVAVIQDSIVDQHLETERRDAVLEQIERVRVLATSIDAEEFSAEEEWTTRPLRLRISPAVIKKSRSTVAEDLADELPAQLAESLVSNTELPIGVVHRESIGDVLYEQELAELSKEGTDRIRLMRLMGARLMIDSEFGVFLGQDFVRLKIIDTETSEETPLERVEFSQNMTPEASEAWYQGLVRNVLSAVREAYPIRGRLVLGPDGATIDVGTNVGVRQGMEFHVLTGPAIEHRLGNALVRVVGDPNPADAAVDLIEFSPGGLAAEDWFVEEVR